MSEFLFEKSKRVTIPAELAGAEGVQGVIVGTIAKLGREPQYIVQFHLSDTVNEDECLTTMQKTLSESMLLAAQPGPMVTAAQANLNAENYARQQCERVRAEMVREHATIVRKLSRKRTRK